MDERNQPDAALRIDQRLFPFLDFIADGVLGYCVEQPDGALWYPLIQAEDEGTGHVAAFLDALPHDRQVVVPTVLHPKLAAMLERRGFSERCWTELIDGESTMVDAWVRDGTRTT